MMLIPTAGISCLQYDRCQNSRCLLPLATYETELDVYSTLMQIFQCWVEYGENGIMIKPFWLLNVCFLLELLCALTSQFVTDRSENRALITMKCETKRFHTCLAVTTDIHASLLYISQRRDVAHKCDIILLTTGGALLTIYRKYHLSWLKFLYWNNILLPSQCVEVLHFVHSYARS